MAASETEPGGYADYTAEPPLTLNLAGENSIILTPNDDLYFRRWMVFADLNGDHDFSDPGETLLEMRSQGAITGAIDLTGGSQEHVGQTTRLRVLMDWASASRPCGRASMGEYEDYRVTLVTQPDPMPEPTVAFSYGVVADSTVVQFENHSESVPAGATWSWQYRRLDQALYTEFAATHGARFDFGQAGDYSVLLMLTLADGREVHAEQAINVPEPQPDPEPEFDIEVSPGSADVTLINHSNHYLDSAQWAWNYGDGQISEMSSFQASHRHTYNVARLPKDTQEIIVTLSISQNGTLYQQQKILDRNRLPKAGAVIFALPLCLWLLLLRIDWHVRGSERQSWNHCSPES
jgi:hypothetical protein